MKLHSLVIGLFLLISSFCFASPQSQVHLNPQQSAVQSEQIHKELANFDLPWELQSDEDGVKVWKRHLPGSSLVEFKGETVIPDTLPKIVEVLTDTSRKLEWIDRIHTARDVQILSPFERIEYNRTKAPWPVKDRDFVFKAQGEVDLENRRLTVHLKSVEHPAMPEQDCCVRGDLKSSTYVLEALGDGSETKVTVQIHADPGGAVPTWIVNMIQKSWPRKTLSALAAQVAKPDVVENEYFKTLFKKAQHEHDAAASAHSKAGL